MRPSIVSASLNEPYPGWVDNFNGNLDDYDCGNNFNYYYHDDHKHQNIKIINNPIKISGPSGIIAAAGKGIMRTLHCKFVFAIIIIITVIVMIMIIIIIIIVIIIIIIINQ